MTDSHGYSSGQLTAVLGEAVSVSGNGEKKRVKVGFIDKIQNVPSKDIPLIIEGVRLSLLEKGYILALPEDLGINVNGIANENYTRSYIKQNIKIDLMIQLMDFKPHSHNYTFPNLYSRADMGLISRPILPFDRGMGVEVFTPDKEVFPWKLKDLDIDKLIQDSHQLKYGTVEDKLRYIYSAKAIQMAGLKSDPQFSQTLQRWLDDKSEPMGFRRQILLYLWKEEGKNLFELLNNFSEKDQINVLQNLLDTPRYREDLLKKKEYSLELLMRTRSNKKVREQFIQSFYPQYFLQIEKILTADIDSARAKLAIVGLEKFYNTPDIERVSQYLDLFRGTSLEVWAENDFLNHFLKNVLSESVFTRNILLARSLMKKAFGIFLNYF